jgi:type I restriction enzyme M protein
MAIKKSDLYSSIWASCDELRGGMDASQYKDYVLFMLFIKYVSDKYGDSDDFAPPVKIPKGASFKDMVALKGNSDIGNKINTQVIQPLIDANTRLARSDFPDFNDSNKLGDGAQKVEKLTNLVAIFENPALDFSKNRAENDDILGDAYEYLMRHFATQSGKSKGQFYTPSEVSRIMAKVIGISPANTKASTTAYDPTCGSGSLLLKVAAEAGKHITLEGQEKDVTTAGLARMNMILHDFPTANILSGNTLFDPKFKDGEQLRTYDYVVANPPFSDKTWSTGLTLGESGGGDRYQRFTWGVPPRKQGDYAYLLHIIRSMKSKGKAACIMPHGVLFRGNAEAVIRQQLVRSGYLKGLIGLPANLFFGTGIPACIVVLDKENAAARKGIFMIDASQDFMKDGPKNRLRERDFHKIVDTFNRQDGSDPRYARMVSVEEIAKNEYNLNLPRYIDSAQREDLQDIAGHLQGGIPAADVDALQGYWDICPKLRQMLFKPNRPGYLDLAVDKAAIKSTIYDYPEFATFIKEMNVHFAVWRDKRAKTLRQLKPGFHPKETIVAVAEDLLAHYAGKPLIDKYHVYQHLMDYWPETMQDDCYLIAADGWKAETYRIIEKDKKGKAKDKGWACDLVPKPLLVAHYFAAEQTAIDHLNTELEAVTGQMTELEEEHGGEEGVFADLDKINKATVAARLLELLAEAGQTEGQAHKVAEAAVQFGDQPDSDANVLLKWLNLHNREADLKQKLKYAETKLDKLTYEKYPQLSEDEVKTLVVDDKWLATLDAAIHGEMDRISQSLTQRVKELAERYETPMPQMAKTVAELEAKVNRQLQKMGFSWK